jgi:PKHD-type hydroxylase
MDLNSFEPFQLTEYNSNEKQFYDWHVDNTSDFKYNITRKLSCILFLTEPQAYEGGKFQYKVGIDDQEIDQPRGRVVVFPSYTLHRVTPVTRGIRRSVVTWVSGPPFK